MKRKFIVTAIALALALGVPAFAATTIPQGTTASVRISTALDSGTAKVGQTWQGTLTQDLTVNGATVAKTGDAVSGKVTVAKDSGRLHAPGELGVRVTSIAGIPVSSNTHLVKGQGHMKSNAIKIGGGTAAGALIGGLAGGGKGAAIGAGVGAAGGTGVAMATGKMQAHIPAEAVMSFKVTTTSTSAKALKKR